MRWWYISERMVVMGRWLVFYFSWNNISSQQRRKFCSLRARCANAASDWSSDQTESCWHDSEPAITRDIGSHWPLPSILIPKNQLDPLDWNENLLGFWYVGLEENSHAGRARCHSNSDWEIETNKWVPSLQEVCKLSTFWKLRTSS